MHTGLSPYSKASLQVRMETSLKREMERSVKAGKQRNQNSMKPSEVEAKAASIRNDVNEALKEEVRLRILKDQFFLEGKTEENAKMVESVAMGVAKTDALMAKLYRFLLQSATNTFIDLHFLKVTEAESVLALFLKHISSPCCTARTEVTVVTGRGLHSQGGVPILRPAIKNYLDRQNIKYKEQPGSFRILPP
ncbi:Hypothetical predicted protein [Cloeon dipterum]|uniref:Smr domain-containing protein n=1 Tax=Cloeon dipterum TaxID=197152 RepID=A0A8S1E2Y6_9INSE|nr:Hypothetical predicted protein [Cloeon dipterum]